VITSTPLAAESIASLVRTCPSVARLSSGRDGNAVTYGPGAPVVGVRFTDRGVEVHVVTVWGIAPIEAAAEVRETLRPTVDGQAIDVVIEDIDSPPRADETTTVGSSTS
jgi:hypothetical protein